MGYDLHITRRKRWPDKGNDISADEWLAYVRRDQELRLQPENGPYFAEWISASQLDGSWLDWSNGEIYTKNPEAALIDKMVAIARQFGGTVQGDDGEIYDGGSDKPRQLPLSLGERLRAWFTRLRPRHSVKIEHEPLPFDVGDRVRDSWGNEHTVIQIDPRAEHGLGVIRTRRDNGSELAHIMIAHGLKPVAKSARDDTV
jgi:hypothetical protein